MVDKPGLQPQDAVGNALRGFARHILAEGRTAVEDRKRIEARDLARMLAGARDAQAALDAVADLEHHAPSHRLSSQSWDTIRQKLEDLRASAETAGLTNSIRTRISAALDRAEARIE